jgi:hypothetical protein
MAISTLPVGTPIEITRVVVRPILAEEEEDWNRLMDEAHPLGNAQFAGYRVKYVAEYRGRAVALCCMSGCAYHVADRDRWIGWSPEQATRRRNLVVQNSRFLVLSVEKRRNLASRVLSQVAKRLPGDWEDRFGFAPLLLESFIDPVRFRGTCYRAAGWTQVGSTRGFSRDGKEFYSADSHPKQIWTKELRKDARELLRSETLPDALRSFESPLPGKVVATRLGFGGLRTLADVLWSMPDVRRAQGTRYSLGTCLAIVLCGYLAGCRTLRGCAEFGRSLSQKHLEALRAWRNPKTGRYEAPGHVTLWRTVSSVDPEQFERLVMGWFRDEGRLPEAIAIDGKTLRATLLNGDGGSCAVSAVSHAGTPFLSTRSSSRRRDRR